MTKAKDMVATKIDHVPIVQALRKMEQYMEKHFSIESLDATYPTWEEICNYIEGKERAKLLGQKLGMPSPSEIAKAILAGPPEAGAKVTKVRAQ